MVAMDCSGRHHWHIVGYVSSNCSRDHTYEEKEGVIRSQVSHVHMYIKMKGQSLQHQLTKFLSDYLHACVSQCPNLLARWVRYN